MEITTSAAPAAAPAAPAAEPSSTPASSPVDYSITSDSAILESAFAPKEEPPAERPAVDTETKVPVEAKEAVEDKTETKQVDEEIDATTPDPEDLKRMFKAHPEARAAWHRDRQFREVFQTPAEAREYRELLPTLEYAKEVVQQAETLLAADRLFMTDPGTFAQRLADANPKAFFGMLERARSSAYAKDPVQYREKVAEPMWRDTITRLKQSASEAQNEELDIACQIFEEALGLAKGKPAAQTGPVDPRIRAYEDLEKRARNDYGRMAQSFNQTVERDVDATVQKVIADLVQKPAGLSEKALGRLIEDVAKDVYTALDANGHVKATFVRMVEQGDYSKAHLDRITDFVRKQASQLAPSRVKTHLNAWTKDYLQLNGAQLRAAESIPNRKDVGATSPSSANSKPTPKIDSQFYRTHSDLDILNDNTL
jgi:hypothetical protein